MTGEYHIREYVDYDEPSKGKIWSTVEISQGHDGAYTCVWGGGESNTQDITRYSKSTVQQWMNCSNITLKDDLTKKLIDKHIFI